MAAIALAVLAVLILGGSQILYVLTHQNLAENGGQDLIILATFVTVGLVIAWHRPANPIGWIILRWSPPTFGCGRTATDNILANSAMAAWQWPIVGVSAGKLAVYRPYSGLLFPATNP